MQNLHIGITRFCEYWENAPTLQTTYISLLSEISSESDGCIDAAKAIVECACKVLISELDNPTDPIKDWANSPIKNNTPTINNLVVAVVRLLKLNDKRLVSFNRLISQHHQLAKALGDFRNVAGTLSHGKDGFSKKLSTYHIRSAILSADAIVLFLHEAYLERQLDPINSFEPFERFSDQSATIDKHCAVSVANVEENYLQVKIALPDSDNVELFFNPSKLLFFADRIAYKSAFNECKGIVDDEQADDEQADDEQADDEQADDEQADDEQAGDQ